MDPKPKIENNYSEIEVAEAMQAKKEAEEELNRPDRNPLNADGIATTRFASGYRHDNPKWYEPVTPSEVKTKGLDTLYGEVAMTVDEIRANEPASAKYDIDAATVESLMQDEDVLFKQAGVVLNKPKPRHCRKRGESPYTASATNILTISRSNSVPAVSEGSATPTISNVTCSLCQLVYHPSFVESHPDTRLEPLPVCKNCIGDLEHEPIGDEVGLSCIWCRTTIKFEKAMFQCKRCHACFCHQCLAMYNTLGSTASDEVEGVILEISPEDCINCNRPAYEKVIQEYQTGLQPVALPSKGKVSLRIPPHPISEEDKPEHVVRDADAEQDIWKMGGEISENSTNDPDGVMECSEMIESKREESNANEGPAKRKREETDLDSTSSEMDEKNEIDKEYDRCVSPYADKETASVAASFPSPKKSKTVQSEVVEILSSDEESAGNNEDKDGKLAPSLLKDDCPLPKRASSLTSPIHDATDSALLACAGEKSSNFSRPHAFPPPQSRSIARLGHVLPYSASPLAMHPPVELIAINPEEATPIYLPRNISAKLKPHQKEGIWFMW